MIDGLILPEANYSCYKIDNINIYIFELKVFMLTYFGNNEMQELKCKVYSL